MGKKKGKGGKAAKPPPPHITTLPRVSANFNSSVAPEDGTAMIGGGTPVPAAPSDPAAEARNSMEAWTRISDCLTRKLNKLSLASLSLARIPSGISKLASLTFLNAPRNAISSVGVLESTPVLTELDLSQNRLNAPPAGMSRAKSLRILRLNGNGAFLKLGDIAILPLTELELSSCGLVRPPLGLSTGALTKSLLKLDLSWNSLAGSDECAEIGSLTALQQLSMQGNPIESIPDAIGQLTSCTWLSFDDCRLSAITDESPVLNLVGLKTLRLGNNLLTELPVNNLRHLESLETIVLKGNPNLQSIPESIVRLPEECRLVVHSCPGLTEPPSDIAEVSRGGRCCCHPAH